MVGGTDEDPGVSGFLWARTADVVDAYLHQGRADTPLLPESQEPSPSLLGFTPLDFGHVLAYEKRAGRRPMRTASYRFTDGAFTYSSLSGEHRDYLFADANPDDQDPAIGVVFRLDHRTRAGGSAGRDEAT